MLHFCFSLVRAISLALLVQSALAASEPDFELDLRQQDLGAALNTLSQTLGIRIMSDADAIKGKRGPALKGRYSRPQALAALLKRSGLQFKFISPEKVAIYTDSQPAAPAPTVTLEAVSVTEHSASPERTGYHVADAGSATKTRTPVMETPVAVEAVTEKLMRDQQITRIGDALKYVSGVMNKPSGINGDFDFLYFRGFYYGDRIYRDGVPLRVGEFNNGQRDTANIARLDVVKGPPSLMYGRADPGGMVNIVTKQPESQPYHALTQQIGSWDLFRTTLDSTGPLNAAKSLAYRFNFDFEKSNSFRDFVHHDRKFFSPVMRWDVSPRTQINFEAEYREGTTLVDPGLPLIGGTNLLDRRYPGRIPHVPISTFYGSPDDVHRMQESLFGINWSHAFSDQWTLRHRFNAVLSRVNLRTAQLANTAAAYGYNTSWVPDPPGDDKSVILMPAHLINSSEVIFNTVTLTGQFDTWGLGHTLLAGVDQNGTTYRQRILAYPHVLAPVYPPVQSMRSARPVAQLIGSYPESWFGVYLQDQVKLPYGVQLLAGLRYDNARESYSGTTDLYADATTKRQSYRGQTHDTAFTPRFGLLWQPNKAVAWYGNYSKNFGWPNYGMNLRGRALGPELAHQWETGIKTAWLEGRLHANLAAFQITKTHVLSGQPHCPNCGVLRSEGLELDVKGEVWPSVNLVGSYSFIQTRVLRDSRTELDTLRAGQHWSTSPRHIGSVWTTYDWNAGPLAGLTLGGGALIRSHLMDGVREPGYVLFNLMAAYGFTVGRSQVSFQVNVDNVLDKTYYLGSDYWPFDEYPGTPRNVMGSMRVVW